MSEENQQDSSIETTKTNNIDNGFSTPIVSKLPTKKYSAWVKLLMFIQKRKYGQVLEPSWYWGQVPSIYRKFVGMFKELTKKSSPFTLRLRTLVTIKVSQINDCKFCIDMNAYLLFSDNQKVDLERVLDELPKFEQSTMFSDKEKTSLQYALEITDSNLKVTAKTVEKLKKYFSDKEIIELTALICYQNMSSKFNNAINVNSNFLCKL